MPIFKGETAAMIHCKLVNIHGNTKVVVSCGLAREE